MRTGALLVACLTLGAWNASVTDAHGDDRAPADRPFGLTGRVPWTTSRVVGSPDPPSPYRLKRVFPRLKFKSPVCIAQEPGTERLLVAERDGKIFSFPGDDPDADQPE